MATSTELNTQLQDELYPPATRASNARQELIRWYQKLHALELEEMTGEVPSFAQGIGLMPGANPGETADGFEDRKNRIIGVIGKLEAHIKALELNG